MLVYNPGSAAGRNWQELIVIKMNPRGGHYDTPPRVSCFMVQMGFSQRHYWAEGHFLGIKKGLKVDFCAKKSNNKGVARLELATPYESTCCRG